MAAVVRRTFSSSSTTRMRAVRAARWPLAEAVLSGFLSGIRFRKRWRVNGEDYVEGRARPFLARHLDATAVVTHDVLRHPESESRALRPRREERREDARDFGFGNAAPRVADLHGDGRLERLLVNRRDDGDAPALLDGLLRVEQEVEEDLAELVGARAYRGQTVVEVVRDFDSGLPHLLLDEDERLLDDLVDVHPLDLAGASGEAEHLADDVRDALGLAARNVEEARVLLDALRVREEVERVLDCFERVVDLVRD